MNTAPATLPRSLEKAIEDMPTVSPVIGRIQEMSSQIDVSPKELVKVIALDPVLTGKVIHLVNSSFYGLTHKARTLAQAVVLLGRNTVKNLAVSTAVLGALNLRKRSPIEPSAFWRHCLATAVAARMIGRQHGADPGDLETYFIAGLVHDLGKVVLMNAEPDAYAAAMAEASDLGVLLTFAETARFECDHGQVGGVLARRWHLAPEIVEAIERHHQGPAALESNDVVRAVVVANNLAKRLGHGESGDAVVEEVARAATLRLGLDAEFFDRVETSLPAEIERAEVFLRIPERPE